MRKGPSPQSASLEDILRDPSLRGILSDENINPDQIGAFSKGEKIALIRDESLGTGLIGKLGLETIKIEDIRYREVWYGGK